MPGKPLRLAAFRRDYIHVEVAGVFATKRNPFSVRRKVWIRRLALEARHASRHATRSRHSPDVLRISESDLRRADGRRSQQTRAARLCMRSVITELKNSTYYARLILQQQNELGRKIVEIDARPSDCIALATALKKPIYVSSALFEQVEDMSEVLERINENGGEAEA